MQKKALEYKETLKMNNIIPTEILNSNPLLDQEGFRNFQENLDILKKAGLIDSPSYSIQHPFERPVVSEQVKPIYNSMTSSDKSE